MKVIDKIYQSKLRYLFMILMILLGGVLCGISFNIFLIPNKLLSGGISGIALILNYIFGLNAGMMIILANIPIFILGYKFVDKEFIALSLIGMVAFSLSIDFFSFLRNVVHLKDIMLSCIFGGILNGLGMGIVLRNRASQGGVDIIAVIVKKYMSLNIGATSLSINFVIVSLASLKYGLKLAMYTLISMYVASIVLDKVMQGFNTKKAVMIITNKEKEVASVIISQLDRGVTFLDGEGAYTGNKKRVIYCIVTLSQLAKLKQIVGEIDETAFITVSETTEVMGYGFKSLGI